MSKGKDHTTLASELIGEGKFWAINKKLAKYLNIHNTTQITISETNKTQEITSLQKKQNIEDKE